MAKQELRMRIDWVILMLFTAVVPAQGGAQDICRGPVAITYPMEAVVRNEAAMLDARFYEVADFNSATSVEEIERRSADGGLYREVVEDALAALSRGERDIRLLALLDYSTAGSRSLVAVTMEKPTGLFDLWLDVLDRHGLAGQAGAMRKARAAFPNWGDDPRERYYAWSDGMGTIRDAKLDAEIQSAAQAFKAARPTLSEEVG